MSTIWTRERREGVGWAPVETWFGRTLVRSAWEGSYQVAQAIINGGAKKVVSSAPDKDSCQVVVMGVNADE